MCPIFTATSPPVLISFPRSQIFFSNESELAHQNHWNRAVFLLCTGQRHARNLVVAEEVVVVDLGYTLVLSANQGEGKGSGKQKGQSILRHVDQQLVN